MWKAARLAVVCVLGLSGALALRSNVSSQPAPTASADGSANNVVLVNLVSKSDRLETVDVDEKKVVAVEKIRITPPPEVNARAEIRPEHEARHHRHVVHSHRHARSRR
jgi:hypothetical protein